MCVYIFLNIPSLKCLGPDVCWVFSRLWSICIHTVKYLETKTEVSLHSFHMLTVNLTKVQSHLGFLTLMRNFLVQIGL